MSAAGLSRLTAGRTTEGYRLRLEGKGTMRESRAAHNFAQECLSEPDRNLVLDLSGCNYLDSTFQGCLIQIQRAFGKINGSRFVVGNPSEKCRLLLTQSHIDRFLNIQVVHVDLVGNETVLPPEALDSPDMARHMIECHRRLAELGGPQERIYQKIADQLEHDLAGKSRSL